MTEDKKPLVSIIVAIYKVEKYLPLCISSILQSESQEFELILVDDGSPDGCPVICDGFKWLDSRVKVIHKANGGVSDARNAGILQAKGEYLLFVDGDDTILSGSLDQILGELEKEKENEKTLEKDLIFLRYDWVHGDGAYAKKPYEFFYDRERLLGKSREEALIYLESISHYINSEPWGKLIRRGLLVEHGISFVKGIVAEDFAFLLEILNVAESFDCYDFPYYLYLTGRSSSFSSTKEGRRGMFFGLAYSFRKWFGQMDLRCGNENGSVDKCIQALLAEQCGMLLLYYHSLSCGEKKMYKKKVKNYLSLMGLSKNPKIRRICKVYQVFGQAILSWLIGTYVLLGDWKRKETGKIESGKIESGKGWKSKRSGDPMSGKSKKNICFLSGDITRSGGTEHVCLEIASMISQKGDCQVGILSLMESAKEAYYEFPKGMSRDVLLKKPVEPIIKAIYKFFVIEYRLIQYIRKNKIDLLIDVDGILDIFSLPAKLFTKVQVITWEHFNYYTSLGNPFRMLLKKFSARFSDYIVVLTKEDKGYYQKNLKLKCPIEFIYNPKDIPEGLAYDSSSKTILSVGRLTAQKGFDYLMEVARLTLPQHKDWTWVIAGEGEERPALETKVREYGLESQLKLLGNVKDMEGLYSKAAMFVLTSRFEGFPLVIIEAKSHHLPVVSFACKTGPRETVKDGRNGFLVRCFEMEDMAEKINTLMENQALRKQFSSHAVDGMELLRSEAVMEKWEKVLGEFGWKK